MSSITVRPVASARDRRQFLELPWQLHSRDPHWAPPLRATQKELVGYSPHPFYKTAEAQTFLALDGGRPCGRVSAIVNRAHNDRYGEQRGFFGFFESTDDPQVAAALFDAARDWLKGKGMTALRGPTNPSLNYECGLLIDGFDGMPVFMITYNPPYYQTLVEGYGFRKAQDLYSYRVRLDELHKLNDKLGRVMGEVVRRFGVKTRRIDMKNFGGEVESFFELYNASLEQTWGFVPMSEEEVRHTGAGLRHLIAPEMTNVAEVKGKPVGVLFGLLDYNPRIKRIDGRLFPFGFLRLLLNKRGIKKVRAVSTTVLPQYQSMGIGVVLTVGLLPIAEQWGIEEIDFSWVLESNHLSRSSLERGGTERYRTHRIYDLEI